MPIRINLLAEAQAAEELRRRDPIKRAAIIGACLIAMVLVWISSLQLKIMAKSAEMTRRQQQLNSITNDYNRVLSSQKALGDVNDKLKALNRLASERFLNGTLLNAMMNATVDGIQVSRINTEQSYDITAEVKPVTERGHFTNAGKPATAVEKIKLVLNARDSSPNPGSEQINKFKNALVHTDYLRTQQISTNNILLKNLMPAQTETESGKTYVGFSFECSLADRVR